MKRVLSLVLATVMILSLCTFCATAEGTTITEPAQADGYFDLTEKTKPVKIAKVSDGLKATTLWSGNDVTFGDTGAEVVLSLLELPV